MLLLLNPFSYLLILKLEILLLGFNVMSCLFNFFFNRIYIFNLIELSTSQHALDSSHINVVVFGIWTVYLMMVNRINRCILTPLKYKIAVMPSLSVTMRSNSSSNVTLGMVVGGDIL